ncbi:MAG TPA: DUF5916 domain-containing protein [Gemmatimonadaceae bacterium]|nr:DUF5916 domain-containing protein [Gemmatimonadaceae bacterium]
MLLWSAAAKAQPSGKSVTAVRITGPSPRIDGRLDDAAWGAAQVVSDFVQQRPIEGAEPTERTEALFMYDDAALYVGARMFRRDPRLIARPMTRRDVTGNAERFALVLDTYLDRRTAVAFTISAAGVKGDLYLSRDSDSDGVSSQYNPVWDARATTDSTGWTAELRIPFAQLRFTAAEEQVWGLMLERLLPDKIENERWILIPQQQTGYVSRFGTLRGIRGIQPKRPIELVPYMAADATHRANVDSHNPFNDPFAGRVGMDAKLGIGSNLTLDLTVNPDFGQVEADPAEVNLSAFETFFDERRPFFIEGNELIRGQGPGYFYSRRIGAAPHGSAEGDFVDTPHSSTILGAAKLTGRTHNRLSVGSLFAVTREEHARVFSLASATTSRVAVEPLTAYGVVRLQQELGSQASTIGATLTGVRRDLGTANPLAHLLPREAVTGGADFRWRLKEGMYAFTGWYGFSHVAGDSLAMLRLQESSARYYQRPDADYVTYDPRRNSLGGRTASLRADKDAGRRILWGAQIQTNSPGFELNDAGRLNSADEIEYNADIQIRETLPGRYLQNWRLGFDTRGGWNYGGEKQSENWNQQTTLTFKNFWQLNVRTSFTLRAQSATLTRGGPSMGTGHGWSEEVRLNNSGNSRTGWRVNGRVGRSEFGGQRRNAGAQLTLRPTDRWQLSIEPNYSRVTEPRQYVGTFEDSLARFLDSRWVFAYVDRTTLSTRLRANYAFSPTLTLEAYAEPFAAEGHYRDFGELEAPRSRELRYYGTSGTTIQRESDGSHSITDGRSTFTVEPVDFHVLSLRTNMVLRWEWNPGSTLFLVWQQNKHASELTGRPVGMRSMWHTTRAAGDNFFSIKATYWLPL